jgi:hypothetical protein
MLPDVPWLRPHGIHPAAFGDDGRAKRKLVRPHDPFSHSFATKPMPE